MPQIAIIQPAAPQAPPPGPPANEDTQQFSPHLEKAIAGRKDEPSKRESTGNPIEQKAKGGKNISKDSEITGKAPKEAKQGGKPATLEEALETATDSTPATNQPTVPPSETILLLAMGQSPGQTVSNNHTDASALPALSQHLTNNSPLFEFLSKSFSSSNVKNNGLQTTSSQQSWQNYPEGGLLTTPMASAMDLAIAEIESAPLAVDSREAKLENPLISQLQKIIADSNESGKMSITVTGNTLKTQSGFNSLQTAIQTVTFASEPLSRTTTSVNIYEIADVSPMVVLPTGSEMPVEKPSLNLTSLRHSIQQQYFDAKIDNKNNQENQTTSEGEQQSNSFSPKNTANAEGSIGFAVSLDETSTFAQPLALIQEGQKSPTVETSRPITLPSGTVIQQEEVIRQISEHLQLSRRALDTRVNIQLHPAELGELKIDLSVKNGSVRANVVASSQYAQEIIEKNMVKLRTILEGQGFTIGEITVTSKSDTAGDFNLFDRQLFSQDDYTSPSAKKSRTPEAFFTLPDPIGHEQTAVSGVNVKA